MLIISFSLSCWLQTFTLEMAQKILNGRKSSSNEALFCLTSCRLFKGSFRPHFPTQWVSAWLFLEWEMCWNRRRSYMQKFHAGKSNFVRVTFQSKMFVNIYMAGSDFGLLKRHDLYFVWVHYISSPVFPNSNVSIKVLTWSKFMWEHKL